MEPVPPFGTRARPMFGVEPFTEGTTVSKGWASNAEYCGSVGLRPRMYRLVWTAYWRPSLLHRDAEVLAGEGVKEDEEEDDVVVVVRVVVAVGDGVVVYINQFISLETK